MLVAVAGLARAQASPPLADWYARYLAQGRSDAEIHLASDAGLTRARVQQRDDGSVRCQVSGLRQATAGVLVHEVTHCLVGPYIAALEIDDEAQRQQVALASENISDARAVIEVFRADGLAAAEALVATMLPQRLASTSASHATAAALKATLERIRQAPGTLATPQAAFAAALEIGARSAGAPIDALDSALARSRRAFEQGRYANDAFTLHATNDAPSAGDRHCFINADGQVSEMATLGSEGAHGLAALQALIAASSTPEHRLAVHWLQRQGRLDSASLERVRAIFGRFLRSVDGSSADRVARVLEATIDSGPRGLDLSALLDEASDRLRAPAAE